MPSRHAARCVPRYDDSEPPRKSWWILPCIFGGAALWGVLIYYFLS